MAQVKRFTIEHLRSYRTFRVTAVKLKLTEHKETLKESVDFCERMGFCRWLSREPEHYEEPCIHYKMFRK